MRFLLKFFGSIVGILAVLWSCIALWGTFSPIVVLHYSERATDRIGVFFNDNDNTAKFGMSPGETSAQYTAMFPKPDMWLLLTFPSQSTDSLEITNPFRQIDVCIGPGAKIERKVTRHGFLDRFTVPSPPCEPASKR